MPRSLIFLHGGPGFQDYLEPYFRDLRDCFPCVFYDQRSGPTIGIEDLIQQLAEKVGAAEKPVLVGHSWGAVLAVEFARRHQEKLGGLALLCSGLSAAHWYEYREDLRALGLENAPWQELFFVAGDPPAERKALEKVFSNFSAETFDSLERGYVKAFDLTKELSKIALKIVNIYAEKDLRYPPRISRSLRGFQPRIEDHEIAGAGHFPFLQPAHREQVHRILKDAFG